MAQEFDLISVGGGSGGIAIANRAASYGARCAVIEHDRMGGTCVNRGCVPKKIMWFGATLGHALEEARGYGYALDVNGHDWRSLVEKREAYIRRLNGLYDTNMANNGVQAIAGTAQFVDDHTVVVGGEHYSAKHIVIATGGRPSIPSVPGAEHGITSDGFFELQECPRKVAVVGSGYIAVELAGMLRGFGAEVTMLLRKQHLLRTFDAMLRESLMEQMIDAGIEIIPRAQVAELKQQGNGMEIVCDTGTRMPGFDTLIWAIGREPATDTLGLRNTGIATDDEGFVPTDAFQQTNVPGVFAIGDVTGRAQLTPVAIAAGRRPRGSFVRRAAGAQARIQQHRHGGVQPSTDRHGGPDRGGGAGRVRLRRENVPDPVHAHVLRDDRGQKADHHETRDRRRAGKSRGLPHHRHGVGRNNAGLCRGDPHGGDQGGSGRHGGDPSDQCRRTRDDALRAEENGPSV